ncbi:MAG: methyltransferase [Candidatus Thermoplasmatota archaeon]
MKLQILNEGGCSFYAEVCGAPIGPGRRVGGVFYNPAMRHSRDVSVLLMRAINTQEWRMLDGMAASGVRGIRIALEAPEAEVVINDSNPAACAAIEKNIALNHVENAKMSCSDVRHLLHGAKYHYVDIDPFGTPVHLIPHALQGVADGGILALTATDTAVLCGPYRKTCARRYHARTLDRECMHEVGIRILAGYVVRMAASYDLAAQPILCYAKGHFVRCHFRVLRGAGRAEHLLHSIAYADFHGGERWFSSSPESKEHAGPLWSAALFDPELVGQMGRTLDPHTAILVKDLDLWAVEDAAPPLHYDINILARELRASPPKLCTMLDLLRLQGYTAQRTYLSPTGFRTNAPYGALKEAFSESSSH